MTQDELKALVAQAAADYVKQEVPQGAVLGVGTGSTANLFIDAVAAFKERFSGAVSSSEASTRRLQQHGFTVLDLNEVDSIPVYVDGADEIDASGAMKSMDGTPVTVDVTENPNGLFDLPGMSAAEMAHLATLTVYVDMTADAGVGKWVQFAAKIATAYTGGDDVAYLKTMTGDTMTVDGAAKTATLKTADGVFPVALEVPEAGRRLQFGFFGYAVPMPIITTGKQPSSAEASIGGR